METTHTAHTATALTEMTTDELTAERERVYLIGVESDPEGCQARKNLIDAILRDRKENG